MQQQQGSGSIVPAAAAAASGGASSGPANPAGGAGNAARPASAASQQQQRAGPTQAPQASSGTSGASAQSRGAAAAAGQNNANNYRPLNVKDALSYLDSVKNQFQSRPQIYNNFLDIMKDFKTQNIDTPGVIDRVSTLFRGFPALIQGFNTFLPPGYRIDCGTDAAGQPTITITTPSGVTTRDAKGTSSTAPAPSRQPQATSTSTAAAAASTSGAAGQASGARPAETQQRPSPSGTPAHAAASQAAPNTAAQASLSAQSRSGPAVGGAPSPFSGGISGIGSTSRAAASSGPGQAPANPTSSVPASNTAGAQTSAATSGQTAAGASRVAQPAGPSRPPSGAERQRPPAEFNHAINFVNKIKNRFHTRPDTYKAFLEILQTYQKEQRAIQEVYAQVTVLFRDAPDLLEEFKEFLPDTTGQAGLSGAQSSAINVASASAGTGAAPAGQAAQAAQAGGPASGSRAAGTGRNTSTTSLFGVNPSSTSRPQAGGVPSYLHGVAQRDISRTGQTHAGASLDMAASRRQMPMEQMVPGPSNAQQTPSGSIAAGQAERAEAAARSNDDEEWQAQATASAKKRRAANAPAEKGKQAKRSKYAAAGEDSPEEVPQSYGPNRGFGPGGVPPAYSGPGLGSLPPTVQPIILPHALRPHGPRTQVQPMINSEELALFDRIKKFIDDKATYHEFLKLLNLYTAEIIDMPTLLEKSFLFIGGNDELFGLFREFVGEQDGFVEGEEWPIDNAPALERERFELFTLKSYGPSYRKLPYQESKGLACSGRDALCWSVLNDDWVAFATWASEGSGAHRKNAYEDALACSEQERHWYEHYLESMRRSISVLEPIVARITQMTQEERAAFRLKPGLGGQSSSFYERIIRKIYGKDQGLEAIQALYESPGNAAPIILSRMKQKDEEWHRALREWNRVWREVDAKNFYRSLDHQGLTFKNNDKKTTTSKYLISEIDTLRKEQQQKRVFPAHKANVAQSLRPRHQFELHMGDPGVVFDVLKLIFSYLDRATTPYAARERVAIENTLRRLVPLLFNISDKDVESNIAPAIIFGEDGDNPDTDVPESDVEDAAVCTSDGGASASEASPSGTPSGKKGKKSAADLRKKLLTNTVNGVNGQTQAADGRNTTEGERQGDGPVLDESSWIFAGPAPWPSSATPVSRQPPPSPSKLKSPAVKSPRKEQATVSVDQSPAQSLAARYNAFVSQPFYCFIRLFHLLYHRLANLKRIAMELASSEPAEERLNPFAVELGLAVPIPNVDEPGVRRGKNFYEYMLELCERYFDAEIDTVTFEENLRYMWGIKAFPAFTVDKLVASMIKHAHTINVDQRCQDLISLLAVDREAPRTSLRHQIAYRHTAEGIIGGDENMYRLEWILQEDVLSIQLLSPNDLTIDDPVVTNDKRWGHYLDTYTLGQPTEGLGVEVAGPLLERNRAANEEAALPLTGKTDLAIRLGQGDYKLSFVGEETIFRQATQNQDDNATETQVEQTKASRRMQWEKWLASLGERASSDNAQSLASSQPTAEAVPTFTNNSSMQVDEGVPPKVEGA